VLFLCGGEAVLDLVFRLSDFPACTLVRLYVFVAAVLSFPVPEARAAGSLLVFAARLASWP
jgi:hypothetical protein